MKLTAEVQKNRPYKKQMNIARYAFLDSIYATQTVIYPKRE